MFTPQSSGESGKGTDSTGGQSAVLTLVDAKGDRTPIAGPERVPSDATANGSYVEAGQIRAAVIELGGRFGIRVRDPESPFRRDFAGIRPMTSIRPGGSRAGSNRTASRRTRW